MENNNQKDTIEINIMGIRYRVSSKEGEGNAYVKQAAEYVSQMYERLKVLPGFTRRSKDYQNLMMYLNMADDYLRASEWTEERQLAANTDAENEIADLKKQLQETIEQSMETEQSLRDEMVHLKKKVEYSFHERNHYIEQQRNCESKTMALEKEVAAYKTETSVIKRKMEGMRKDAEDAVRLRKEAVTRTKDWEAAMLKLKNELTESYEVKISSLTESYESRLSELKMKNEEIFSKTVADYEDRLSETTKKSEMQIEETRTASVNKNLQFKADCEKQIAQKEADCAAESARVKAECEAAIAKKEADCAEEIGKTKAERDRMIKSLKEENEAKLERMKTAQDAKISMIMTNVNKEKGDITAPFEEEIRAKEQELARRQKQLSQKEEELILLKDQLAEAENKIASLNYKLQEAEIGR